MQHPVPGTGYRVRISATDPAYTSPDDMLNIHITTTIPGTTASSNSPVCVNSTSILLFDVATYPVSSYTWAGPNGYVAATQNPTVPGPITLANAGTYSVTTTHPGCPSSIATVTVIVNNFTPPLPLASSSGHCVGSAINLFANPDTTATGVTYYWAGPVTSGFTSTLQNPSVASATIADRGWYYVTDTIAGCPSFTDSTYVDVTVTTPVSIAITVSPNDTVCQGTNVTFTATTFTGGASPTYQWVVGSTPVVGAVYSTWSVPTLANGDAVYCILNSSLNCPAPIPANSNTITMDMVNNTPLAHISASAGPSVTLGSSVTFSAVTLNGGASPLYQWMVNGVNVPGATGATYTIASVTSSSVVSLKYTSSMSCAVPNYVISNSVEVHPHTVGVANVTASFDNLELFPDPNAGVFTLKGDLGNTTGASVEILNMLGQIVHSEKVMPTGTQLDTIIDLHNIPAGVYLLRISQYGVNKTIRFSVQH
jgi:Secretion system C-terminal sorting domain